MKLTVLMDNNTYIDRYFLAEPAVSYYIEEGNLKLLFDVGYSQAYIHNAFKMNIHLRKLDYVILSHGHNDHTWGLEPLVRLYSEAALEGLDWRKPTIIGHPEVLNSKVLNGMDIGSLVSEEKLGRHFELNFSRSPVWLTDRLVFLGEIERSFHYEGQEPLGEVIGSDGRKADCLWDDSALVYKSDQGLVIIVACSHSGICNTVEYAKKVCGDDRVLDIIGGFHLHQPSAEQLHHTVSYLECLKPDAVHACHCTDFTSKLALARVVDVREVGVGLKLEY